MAPSTSRKPNRTFYKTAPHILQAGLSSSASQPSTYLPETCQHRQSSTSQHSPLVISAIPLQITRKASLSSLRIFSWRPHLQVWQSPRYAPRLLLVYSQSHSATVILILKRTPRTRNLSEGSSDTFIKSRWLPELKEDSTPRRLRQVVSANQLQTSSMMLTWF